MKVQGIHHRPESQWKGSENKEKCWLIKGILHWKTINLKCKKNNKKKQNWFREGGRKEKYKHGKGEQGEQNNKWWGAIQEKDSGEGSQISVNGREGQGF